jgi:multidrug efflux pump subunit AcrA (membrane-fusion protein)
MKLSDLSIQRPVLASMVSLALVLFGAIGYTRLAVREFPDVDPPIVSVSTELPEANPQVVESAVTDILEEELSTVEGLRTLNSSSAEGFSNITLEFNLERGVDAAAQDVRDKVARIRGRRAAFQVPERYADRLQTQQRVTFRVAALPGREFVGTVDFIDPTVQLPGRTIMVKAQVANPKRELQSGMFIEARLATAMRTSAVIVPEDAVIPLQGSTFVWVTARGKATRRQVELGVRTPGFVEVKSGVESGETVVVGGQERLGEGAPVAPKLIQRAPVPGGEESASVGAR